ADIKHDAIHGEVAGKAVEHRKRAGREGESAAELGLEGIGKRQHAWIAIDSYDRRAGCQKTMRITARSERSIDKACALERGERFEHLGQHDRLVRPLRRMSLRRANLAHIDA